MSLLEQLENVYLTILRVVIIVGATGALIAAGFGIFAGLPLLLPDKPTVFKAESVQDADLAAFQREQSGAEPPAAQADSGDSLDQATVDEIDARLVEAARHLASYAQRVQGYSTPTAVIERFLRARRDSLPSLYTEAYSKSVLELAKQTAASNASIDLDALIGWHYQRFIDSAQLSAEKQTEKELNRQAERAKSLAMLIGGAAGFALFLLLVFCFLLVKIERNLRLVNTRVVELPSTSAAAT